MLHSETIPLKSADHTVMSISIHTEVYHWRELPQVSFLLQQRCCRLKHVSQQTRACRDKRRVLSRQKYACSEKTYFLLKLCLSRQNIFVATNTCFVATKMMLVAPPANDTG